MLIYFKKNLNYIKGVTLIAIENALNATIYSN